MLYSYLSTIIYVYKKCYVVMFPQVIPYFYKIPMGKRGGEDVSALEGELKEKLANLNEASQCLPLSKIYLYWPPF